LLGEGGEQLLLGDQAAGDGGLAGELAGVLGLLEDLPQLVLVDEAEVHQDGADLAGAAAGAGFLLGGGGGLLGGRLARRAGLGRRGRGLGGGAGLAHGDLAGRRLGAGGRLGARGGLRRGRTVGARRRGGGLARRCRLGRAGLLRRNSVVRVRHGGLWFRI